MTTATIHQYVPKTAPATGERPEVPIRHMDFQFDARELDDTFFRNTELASAYFEALSIFLTYGEDLVIDTARYHRQFVKDPELKRLVTALIGQEAIHSKMHNEFNDVLAKHRYPVNFYRFLADRVFELGFKKLSNRMQLSLMAGIEHFTAVLAEYMMKHEDIFYESHDEKQRALWMWHMLEESEHKDIAYDVFQELSGDYGLRMRGFALAAFTIFFLVPLGGSLIPVFRKPSNLLRPSYWKDVRRSLAVLAGPREGVFGSTIKHTLDYLRRDFHPSDHDTSAYLEYYKEKLLHPETGLLTPYMTKEFIPGKRA
ncbi:MAG: metal-dependent hydrolase [Alcanivorax sediminis]|uniref:Metal-dependent hydrolase n=1 Tax=Alcanivorax sediminis TaxID=2663008 RepID=A0A6N7LNU4_9GAMM|nr:metal-dependent hydrolase [Alcanivorax sediminis]MQX51738.1 metal-dependent hydrolase [Alcanivorax sediminis]